MLKIIIDATPVYPKPSGVGIYVLSLIDTLYKLQSSENFELGIYYQLGFKNWLRGNLEFPDCLQKYSHHYRLPIPVKMINFFLDHFPGFFPKFLEPRLDAPNIFHGTNYSVFPFQKARTVINIYDLTFLKYPQYIDSVVKQYSQRVKKCLQWTDLILTISQSSKQDIIEYLQVKPEQVWVTPLASRYHHLSLLSEKIVPHKHRFSQYFSRPYILFVSTIEPRKNIKNLITAFEYLKAQEKIEHQLILIGQKGWRYESIFTAITNSPWRTDIHHLDYLSDESVALFYSHADVFVYPSFYEGFGLPVLEAMTLGTPVITSNTSSLPEVAGDAALLIEPNDSKKIAEAILKVIGDSQLRIDLIEKGKERAKLFSWEKTATETLKAYKSLF